MYLEVLRGQNVKSPPHPTPWMWLEKLVTYLKFYKHGLGPRAKTCVTTRSVSGPLAKTWHLLLKYMLQRICGGCWKSQKRSSIHLLSSSPAAFFCLTCLSCLSTKHRCQFPVPLLLQASFPKNHQQWRSWRARDLHASPRGDPWFRDFITVFLSQAVVGFKGHDKIERNRFCW